MKRKPPVDDIQNFAQNIVDTVREPLLILDAALRVRSANRAFYKTFQVSPEETEDHLIYELGNGQWDIPDLRTLLEDIIPQKSVFNDYELEHDFPTIGRKVMLLNARKLRPGDHTEFLVLALEDVTERRRAERLLAEIETYAQNIVGTVREPLLMLDTSLRVRSANRAFYQTFQVSPEETENRLIYELGNGQWDIPALRTLLEDIIPQKSVFNDFELEHTFPSIGRRVMLLNARQLRAGIDTELLVLAMEDVTERRHAERLLAEIETYAQNIVDTVREPLLMLDPTLRVRSANRAFYRTFQVSPEETEGHLIYELGNGQWDIPALRTLLEDIIPQKSLFNDYELEHDFPTIGRKVMLLNARELRAGNHTELLVLALEDVTERRRVHDLELHYTSELQESYRRLQEVEKLRDDLTHMIIHDLRTPLTSVISGMQTLDIVGDLNEDQREMMNIAIIGGETLLGMINDLLDVEKLESGSMQLDYVTLSAGELVASAIAQVASLAESQQLTLVQQTAADLPPLRGDENKLRRTLVNLLGNAIKFTPTGGTITVGARHNTEKHDFVFDVTDTGEGIPPEAFERIFEKFGQVESRQGGRLMSTGLGLTFCKLAVEAHGGHITVESAPGKGSTFCFTIPLASG
jgi:signal transduction histidine kinase